MLEKRWWKQTETTDLPTMREQHIFISSLITGDSNNYESFRLHIIQEKPGVVLAARVVDLGASGPQFEPLSVV